MRGARGVGFAQSIVQHAANAVEMSAAERISALARHVGDRLDDRTGRRDEVGGRERVDSRRRVVVGGQLGAAREPRDRGAVGLGGFPRRGAERRRADQLRHDGGHLGGTAHPRLGRARWERARVAVGPLVQLRAQLGRRA